MTGRSKNRVTRMVLAAFAAASGVAVLAALHGQAEGPADCPAIGDVCDDGTVYAGRAPANNAYLFTTPADAPGRMTGLMKWDEATAYAEGLDAHGHDDWRLPSVDELHILYEGRGEGALRGTFNEGADISRWEGTDISDISRWYWSSTGDAENANGAGMVAFDNGQRAWGWKVYDNSVRPVRSEPAP